MYIEVVAFVYLSHWKEIFSFYREVFYKCIHVHCKKWINKHGCLQAEIAAQCFFAAPCWSVILNFNVMLFYTDVVPWLLFFCYFYLFISLE